MCMCGFERGGGTLGGLGDRDREKGDRDRLAGAWLAKRNNGSNLLDRPIAESEYIAYSIGYVCRLRGSIHLAG